MLVPFRCAQLQRKQRQQRWPRATSWPPHPPANTYVCVLPYFPYLCRKCFKSCSFSWIKPVPPNTCFVLFPSNYNSHTLQVEFLLQKSTLGQFESLFTHLLIQQAGTEYSFWVTHGTRYLGCNGQQYQRVGL